MATGSPASFEDRLAELLAFHEEGEYAAALRIAKELAIGCADPRVFVAYGMSLQGLGHWAEAVTQFQRAIDLKPPYCEGDTRLFLADSLLKSGRRKQAIEQWKIIAAMKPEYPSYEAVPNEAKMRLAEHAA